MPYTCDILRFPALYFSPSTFFQKRGLHTHLLPLRPLFPSILRTLISIPPPNPLEPFFLKPELPPGTIFAPPLQPFRSLNLWSTVVLFFLIVPHNKPRASLLYVSSLCLFDDPSNFDQFTPPKKTPPPSLFYCLLQVATAAVSPSE